MKHYNSNNQGQRSTSQEPIHESKFFVFPTRITAILRAGTGLLQILNVVQIAAYFQKRILYSGPEFHNL